MSGPDPFQLRPVSESDLFWISQRQAELYSADAVPLALLKEWHNTNPRGFYLFTNTENSPVGQITLLPLRPSVLKQYAMEGPGGLTEREIRGRDILSPQEIPTAEYVYIESLILPVEGRAAARKILMEFFPRLIRLVAGDSCRQVCGLAATPAGEKWLARMGGTITSRAECRRDGHPFFQAPIGAFLDAAARALRDTQG